MSIAPRAAALVLLALPLGCGHENETTLIERVQRLEAEARALVHADGCTTVAECKSAALGVKACGGPEEYVVYCTHSTDEAALLEKLREHATAQAEYNRAVGAVSDCLFVVPPNLEFNGGVCRAASRS